jgi:hypothetical protein
MRIAAAPRFTLVALLLLTVPLRAQSPAERATLDTVGARLVRWDSTTDRQPFDQALQQVERILDRNARAAEAWHLLGQVRASMSLRDFVVKSTPYHSAGVSYRRAAMDAHGRALKADSTWLPAAEDLAALIVALRARKLSQDFTASLAIAGRQRGADPVIHLALSRLAWSDGRYGDALREAYAYAEGGDPAIVAIEAARALAAMGRIDSAALAYQSGMNAVSSQGRIAYREDLAWAATPDELVQFDSLATDSVGIWVALFWRQRDALEMRSDGERLREHLRRWVYGHQKFLVHRPDDAPIHSEGQRDNDQWNVMQGTDPFLSMVLSSVALNSPGWKLYHRTQWEVDDRGAIYIRHGEPTKKVSDPSGPPNESWLYQRATDRPIFHFLGSHALGTTAATTLVASLPMTPEMLDSRGTLDPKYSALGEYVRGRRESLYAWSKSRDAIDKNPEFFEAIKMIQQGRNPRSGAVLATLGASAARGGSMPLMSPNLQEKAAAENERGRSTVIAGVSTDGFPQTFDRQLDAVVQLHGIGIGPGEQRRVLAVFALDGKGLTPQSRPDGKPGYFYPVAIRLVALDRSGGIVRQLDTTRNFVTADSLGTGQHLSGFLELPLPAGIYQVRALFSQPGTNAAAAGARDGIDLTGKSSELDISDLLLGREGSNLAWRFADQPFPLNPLNAFPRSTDAVLLYEISGLAPGVKYETVLAVRRPGDKPTSKPAIEVTTAFEPTGAYQLVRQGVGLSQLKPGPYWLEVTLRPVGGDREVSRKQALNILEK